MKYKAILFDMDGVLIDSEELMAKAGMLSIAIDTSFSTEVLVNQSHPDHIIHSLSEMLTILK